MKKKLSILALTVTLFVGAGQSLAQDTFSTNTPATEVTAEVTVIAAPPVDADAPIVIPTPQPEQPTVVIAEPSDRTLYVVGFLLFTLFGGVVAFLQNRRIGDLIDVAKLALDNKNLQDEARERYMQSSLSTQETIKFLKSALRLLGAANLPVIDPLVDKAVEFGGKVTASTN